MYTPTTFFNNSFALQFNPDFWVDASAGRMYQEAIPVNASTTDGDPVAFLPDLSGNNRNATQATNSFRPTLKTGANGINGKQVLLFDGIDDTIRTPTWVQAWPQTIFLVCEIIVFGASARVFAGVNTQYRTLVTTTGPAYRMFDGSTPLDSAAGPSPALITCEFLGATERLTVNGVTVSTAAVGTDYGGGFVLSGTNAGTLLCNMKLAEFMAFDSALGASEVAQIQAYLNQKWSVY